MVGPRGRSVHRSARRTLPEPRFAAGAVAGVL